LAGHSARGDFLQKLPSPHRRKKPTRAQGAGVATGPVKFVVGALRGLDWTCLGAGGRLDRLYIRVHLWWVSRWARRLLVVAGARCPLTKPVFAAVELQATTEPHCSRGVQPGGICAYVVRREPTPGSGVGLAPGPQALPTQAPPPPIFMAHILVKKPKTSSKLR
jgi:hypothetical protein